MSPATHPAAGPSLPASTDGLRDGIAEHFKPATAYERHLVTIAARAYERYEKALDMEQRAFAKTDPLEMLAKQPDLFKSITRFVADAERGWRKSLEEIRRAIRQRPKTAVPSGARPRQDTAPAPEVPIPPQTQAAPAAAAVRRE